MKCYALSSLHSIVFLGAFLRFLYKSVTRVVMAVICIQTSGVSCVIFAV